MNTRSLALRLATAAAFATLATGAFAQEPQRIAVKTANLSPFVARAIDTQKQLVDVLSTLTPREEKVLKLRFGIEDGRTRTLEEVGKEFNVTRERIRQIEAKALRKLRHPSRSKKLKDFLN